MATIFIRVKDATTGKPIKGARVHGQYHWGSAVGNGTNGFDGLTGDDGQFGIGVSGSWLGDMQADFNYTIDANGYYSDNFQRHLGGITGDYGFPADTLTKVAVTSPPPPGAGPIAGPVGDIGRGGQAAGTQIQAIGTTATIIIIVVVIAIVLGLVVLAYLLGPGSIAGATQGAGK